MSAPPVPPRPFDDYDQPPRPSEDAPPAVPPLPPDFVQDQYPSAPHYEDPLVAPRPQKLQPDLPQNMARTLEEQSSPSSFQPPPRHSPPLSDPTAFPQPMFGTSFSLSKPVPPLAPAHQHTLGFAAPAHDPRRQSPLPPPQGSNWQPWSPPELRSGPGSGAATPSRSPIGFPEPFASGPAPHQHRPSLSTSLAGLSFQSSHASSPSTSPVPGAARDGPPSLTAPLPTIATLSVQQSAVQQPNCDPARQIAWCKDVLALVDRAQQLLARTNTTSTDPALGAAQIDDPELQKLVDVALPLILRISSQAQQGPLPLPVAEAVYMRATCAATGIYPQFIPHDPRSAFRDFERAAKAGYHAAWFKLGREYENFGDVQHAKDCFERGLKRGVESCFYRLGMAKLMGQLGFRPDPQAALPLLSRAATLATIEVPQPAYVYGLLLLNEFSHVSIPPRLFQPLLAPGVSPQGEARRHLERAAYLNFAPAQYKLGHAYEFATPPFPFDALLSVQYYSLASQQGETEADMALSKWFLCGAEGAFDKDEGLAWTFAEKAARKGLASAEFALGYYSEVGVGGPKDVKAAQKWYTRAAEHGNTDATERLQALAQPDAQALSREQHETLTDAKLVRKRTQAKQRSEAVTGVAAPAMPVEQRSQIVNNIRKDSMRVAPAAAGGAGMGTYGAAGAGGAAAASGYGAAGAAHSGYGGSPPSNSPPNIGQPTRLPPADEYANGPRRTSAEHRTQQSYGGTPQLPPGALPPPNAAFQNARRYSLVDPGSGGPSPAAMSAGSTPPNARPPNGAQQRAPQNAHRYNLADPGAAGMSPVSPRPPTGQQRIAGTPPLRRQEGRQSPQGTLPPQGSSPAFEPGTPNVRPGKGPATFAEMGIATQRAEENSNCVVM
ncbi:HCP-like protein [Lenzites betulinus]|nr:HCP-like protein [Lenzites betulinus]